MNSADELPIGGAVARIRASFPVKANVTDRSGSILLFLLLRLPALLRDLAPVEARECAIIDAIEKAKHSLEKN